MAAPTPISLACAATAGCPTSARFRQRWESRSWPVVLLALSAFTAAAQTATVPAGVPLRVQIDHRYRVRSGTHVAGHLIAPVYLIDHEILPVNTPVTGLIRGKLPPARGAKTQALLAGDFTPQGAPDIVFNAIDLPGRPPVSIATDVVQRDAAIIHMRASKKRPSLFQQAKAQLEDRRREAIDEVHHPNLGDRCEKWLYGQLPWHPQMIWTGTEYDAQLTAPAAVPEGHPAPPLPVDDLQGATPTGIIQARLTAGISSATAKKGEPVTAVITRPLLTPDNKEVIVPEGAKMDGFVTQAQTARWFARNGKLRFTFHSLETPGQQQRPVIHGDLSGAEAAPGDHVQISEEGTAQATSGPGKYLAPMALGVLATTTFGDDAGQAGNSAVVSNGFGLVARVAAIAAANPYVARSFAFFALSKSIYSRWIEKGHEIEFPKDTRLEVTLNQR